MSMQGELFAAGAVSPGSPAPAAARPTRARPAHLTLPLIGERLQVVETMTRSVAPYDRFDAACGACGVIGERRLVWVLAAEKTGLACTACELPDAAAS